MREVISRIAIQNLRSHVSTEFRFGPGTNVLVGPMGAGKSTVLEAISLALFGDCPARKRGDVTLGEIIRQGEKEARVELEFVGKDGKTYTVQRKFGERSEATLRAENGNEITGVKKVTEVISEKLGISYDVFERAVFAEQGRLDAPIAGTGKSRKERIDELLGLLVLEDARKTAMKVAKSLGDRAEELRKSLLVLESEKVEEKLVELASRISSLQREIAEARVEVDRKEKELAAVKEELEKLRSLKGKADELRKRLREIEGREEQQRKWVETLKGKLGEKARLPLSVLQNETDRLREEVEVAERGKIEIEQAEQKVREEFLELSSQVSDLMGKLRSAQELLKVKEEAAKRLADLGKVDETVQALEEECTQLQAEISKAEARAERLLETLANLQQAVGICPTCQAPLDERRKSELLAKYREELDNCRRSAEKFKLDFRVKRAKLEQWKAVQGEAQRLRGKAEGIEEVRKQIIEIEGKLDPLKKETERLKSELAQIQEKRREKEEQYNKLVSEFNRVKEELRWREELEKGQEELIKIQASKLQLNSQLTILERNLDEEKLKQLEQKLPSLAAEVARLRTQLEASKRQLEEDIKRGEELDKKQKQIEEGRARLNLLREYSLFLSKAKEVLQEVQEEVRATYVSTINILMSSLWRQLYLPGRSTAITDVALRVVEGDYTLQALRGGTWVSVEGGVSGGERAIALLALRMAFALAIAPEFGLVVLDEPTYGLDQHAIETLAEVLRENLPQGIRQVILISHEPALKEAASSSVYELTNEGGRTVVLSA